MSMSRAVVTPRGGGTSALVVVYHENGDEPDCRVIFERYNKWALAHRVAGCVANFGALKTVFIDRSLRGESSTIERALRIEGYLTEVVEFD